MTIDPKLIASILSYPIQLAWKKLGEIYSGDSSQLTTLKLSEISEIMQEETPLLPGVVKADRQTLAGIQKALPSSNIRWVHQYDFGGSFRWSILKHVENFADHYQGPEHEFLDGELEGIRKALLSGCQVLVHLAGSHTEMVPHSATENDEVRRWPDYFDDDDNYREFRTTADEINAVADKVWEDYSALIRRARRKLALSDTGIGES